MPIIRFMTEEEEKDYPSYTGLADEAEGTIALRRGYPPKSFSRTIRHELGHSKYPVDIPWKPSGGPTNWEEFCVKDLFRELGAAYYALSVQPRDSDTRDFIRKHKRQAREDGLTRTMISRIDKLARERVGYKGKEIR